MFVFVCVTLAFYVRNEFIPLIKYLVAIFTLLFGVVFRDGIPFHLPHPDEFHLKLILGCFTVE